MKVEYDAARVEVRKSRELLTDAELKLLTSTEAATILQSVASHVQRAWYENLGRIVSKALATVFPDSYEFKLVFKQLANRTQVQFLLERDLEEYDPMTSTGGGVVDVVGFALRVAVMMISVQGQRKCIIADEPFKFVSVEYRLPLRVLLERLAVELGIQLIIVTHMEEMEMGKVIRVG